MTAVQTSNPVHDAEGAVEAGIHEVGATIDAVEREVGRGVSTRFPLNSAFIFTFGALGGMLFGFDTGIISGASPLIESDFGLSVAQTGFITSSVLIGSCAGALSIGALSDRFGRKKLLILAAILFLLGSGMCAGSTGFLMMVVARIILGLAVGAASALTPAYLAELAPKERRGSLSTLFQLMVTFGILLAYLSNYLIRISLPTAQPVSNFISSWRRPPSALLNRFGARFRGMAGRSALPPAWASPCIRTMAKAPAACCNMPRWRCTWASSSAHPTPSTAPSWTATACCAWP